MSTMKILTVRGTQIAMGENIHLMARNGDCRFF